MKSKGSDALDRILTTLPGGERAAARLIGCSPGSINHWRHANGRTPGRVFACKMHDLWGLDPRWWEQPPEIKATRRRRVQVAA